MNILELPTELLSHILTLYAADYFQNLGKEIKDGEKGPREVVEAVMQLELVCKRFYNVMRDGLGNFQVMDECLRYTELKQALHVLFSSPWPEDIREARLKQAIEQIGCPEESRERIEQDIRRISRFVAVECGTGLMLPEVGGPAPRLYFRFGAIIGCIVNSLEMAIGLGIVVGFRRAASSVSIVGFGLGISPSMKIIVGPGMSFASVSSALARTPPRQVRPVFQDIGYALTRGDVQRLFRELAHCLLTLREARLSDKTDASVEGADSAVNHPMRPGNN